jgi:uncharacterized membrane protein YuzA (DUF378 family)
MMQTMRNTSRALVIICGIMMGSSKRLLSQVIAIHGTH